MEGSEISLSIPIYLDYKEMLNNKDIEAVDIALPIHLNYTVTKDALDKKTGYFLEFTDFYNAIRKGTKVRSSFYEGYKDLQVIMEALKSADSGKRIQLK